MACVGVVILVTTVAFGLERSREESGEERSSVETREERSGGGVGECREWIGSLGEERSGEAERRGVERVERVEMSISDERSGEATSGCRSEERRGNEHR